MRNLHQVRQETYVTGALKRAADRFLKKDKESCSRMRLWFAKCANAIHATNVLMHKDCNNV